MKNFVQYELSVLCGEKNRMCYRKSVPDSEAEFDLCVLSVCNKEPATETVYYRCCCTEKEVIRGSIEHGFRGVFDLFECNNRSQCRKFPVVWLLDVSWSKIETVSAVISHLQLSCISSLVAASVCLCARVSFRPPIYPSIRSLDKVHVSLSPGLSGLSHKLLLPERLMAVLISHLEAVNRWTCRHMDLPRTPRVTRSLFVLSYASFVKYNQWRTGCLSGEGNNKIHQLAAAVSREHVIM